MVNPRGIKDQEGGWLPQSSQGTQRSGEGGYLTRYSKIRGRWLYTSQDTHRSGRVATSQDILRSGQDGYPTRYSQIRGEWLPHKILTDKGRVSTSQDTHRSGEVGYLKGDKIRGTYFQRGDRVHEDQLQAPSRHPCGLSLSVSLCLWTTTVSVGSP